ncbi:MAG: hypothetical protein CL484_09945 [Acidobacteria bacterium]|nr:hypothetical protein [Acidobacteriota bacterium]
MSSLELLPITQKEAKSFIEQYHRHHAPSVGGKFSVAVAMDDTIVGVAMAGRPVSRILDDGFTLEINRVCTDGTRNACSKLYAACMRTGREMGYKRFITYTLPEESGASLRGAGWRLVGEVGGGNWNKPSRPRVDTVLTQGKLRWEG